MTLSQARASSLTDYQRTLLSKCAAVRVDNSRRGGNGTCQNDDAGPAGPSPQAQKRESPHRGMAASTGPALSSPPLPFTGNQRGLLQKSSAARMAVWKDGTTKAPTCTRRGRGLVQEVEKGVRTVVARSKIARGKAAAPEVMLRATVTLDERFLQRAWSLSPERTHAGLLSRARAARSMSPQSLEKRLFGSICEDEFVQEIDAAAGVMECHGQEEAATCKPPVYHSPALPAPSLRAENSLKSRSVKKEILPTTFSVLESARRFRSSRVSSASRNEWARLPSLQRAFSLADHCFRCPARCDIRDAQPDLADGLWGRQRYFQAPLPRLCPVISFLLGVQRDFCRQPPANNASTDAKNFPGRTLICSQKSDSFFHEGVFLADVQKITESATNYALLSISVIQSRSRSKVADLQLMFGDPAEREAFLAVTRRLSPAAPFNQKTRERPV
jgi:hypothetical protein